MKRNSADETKPIKRRRYPLSKLIDGKSQTIHSECGPVVVSTKHEDGQLLVVVDVPAESERILDEAPR